MKNFNKNILQIEKTTMRELTAQEIKGVAGGDHEPNPTTASDSTAMCQDMLTVVEYDEDTNPIIPTNAQWL